MTSVHCGKTVGSLTDQEDAVVLFENKLESRILGGNVAKLAAALEFISLALIQAEAHISQQAPRCLVA